MKLVLDVSTLLAASLGHANAHALVRALRLGSFETAASLPLLLQYESSVLTATPKGSVAQGIALTRAFARNLAAICQPVVLNPLWRPQCRDAVDDLLLATAHAARAPYVVIVRDASRLAAAATPLGVRVITPEQALLVLSGNFDLANFENDRTDLTTSA